MQGLDFNERIEKTIVCFVCLMVVSVRTQYPDLLKKRDVLDKYLKEFVAMFPPLASSPEVVNTAACNQLFFSSSSFFLFFY